MISITLDEESANEALLSKSKLTCYYCRVLFEARHALPLTHHLWEFSYFEGRIEELLQRSYGLQKPKAFIYLFLVFVCWDEGLPVLLRLRTCSFKQSSCPRMPSSWDYRCSTPCSTQSLNHRIFMIWPFAENFCWPWPRLLQQSSIVDIVRHVCLIYY